jgi:hypothetical protein
VIALVLGVLFKDTPAAAPHAAWPYWLAGYGALAAVVPWLTGGLGKKEFSPGYSMVLLVTFAAPMALAAWWLADSPYRAISIGCAALAGLWVAHLMIALSLRVMRRREG